MAAIIARLHELGELHDATIRRLVWAPSNNASGRCEIHLENINANSEGLPDYPGAQPGILRLDQVSAVNWTGMPDDWIKGVTVSPANDGLRCLVQMRRGSVGFDCQSAELIEVRNLPE